MIDAAGGHGTATIFEAAGAGVARACDPGLRAAWAGARVAGRAFTVRGVGGDNLALHEAVDAAPAGSVLVVDVQRAANGHWGEILAVAAQQRGIAGLVIDGGVRDTDELARLGFGVFARAVTVVGTTKCHHAVFGGCVDVGGAGVEPGDLVVGDADGVVTVRAEAVDETLRRAAARVADEQRILAALRDGQSTLDLYDLPRAGRG